MWQLINSKTSAIIIVAILTGASYLAGVNRGANKAESQYKDRELQIQLAHNLQLQKWQAIAESSQVSFYKQKESDQQLYQRLNNEYQHLKDNLNHCELSEHRLRGILTASKNNVLLPSPTTSTTATTNRKSADISGMTCNGLYKSYLACAESYARCYNGYNQLWQWNQKVSKP